MQKLLKYWQKKLQLNDWNITLIDNCPSILFKTQGDGESEFDPIIKWGVIRIVSEKEYGDSLPRLNKEQVLLHELLHIKFGLLWETQNDTQNIILHQLIDDMAKTLYEVHKQCKQ